MAKLFHLTIRSLIVVGVVLVVFAAFAQAAFAQGGIKGKVRNNRGSGIPNASVTARLDGKDIKTVKADEKGEFVMTGLSSATYSVLFDASGYAPGVMYGVEVKNSTRDLGSRLILMPDQGTQVIVRGSVFYREGTSVTGAKVELRQINADGSTKLIGTVYTNISGDFSFRRPEGVAKYRVTASFKGISGSKDVEVDNPAIYRTAITLDLPRTEK